MYYPVKPKLVPEYKHELGLKKLAKDFPKVIWGGKRVAPGHLSLARRLSKKLTALIGEDTQGIHLELSVLASLADGTARHAPRAQYVVTVSDKTRMGLLFTDADSRLTTEEVTKQVGHIFNVPAANRCPACGGQVFMCEHLGGEFAQQWGRSLSTGEPVVEESQSVATGALADVGADEIGVDFMAEMDFALVLSEAKNQKGGKDSSLRGLGDFGHRRVIKKLPANYANLLSEFLQRHPNMHALHEFLLDQFSLASLKNGAMRFPPVLLQGPPGLGKTEAASWLARRMGVPSTVIDMTSAQEGMLITGSDSRWSNSQPGKPFQVLATHRYANPIIVLDEVDKTSSHRGDKTGDVLLGILESSSSCRYTDVSIGYPADFSHINWVATSNHSDRMSAPLYSRFHEVVIDEISPDHAMAIAQQIYSDYITAHGLRQFNPELSKNVLFQLAECTPREIKRALERALGRLARDNRHTIEVHDILMCSAAPAQKERQFGFITRH